MNTILVTGGAGYIGSQTNLTLLEKGYSTVVLDNLVYGHSEVVPDKSLFFKGDLNDVESIKGLFESQKIDAVVHFAAYTYVGESIENPSKYYHNNVIGTFNLLETMRTFGVNKIIFSSTCATYGIPDVIPITERTPQNPINPYGYSKLIIEQMLKDYHRAYGLNSIYLRYFNACGADPELRTGESHDPETHLIPLIFDAITGKRPHITVFGTDYPTPDGTCIRDYIHTMDLASAHYLALQKLFSTDSVCEPVNLGTGAGYSVKEVIDAAEKITGMNVPIKLSDRRPGDPAQLIADNTKAREYLGWNPTNSGIDFILETAWKWYQHKQ